MRTSEARSGHSGGLPGRARRSSPELGNRGRRASGAAPRIAPDGTRRFARRQAQFRQTSSSDPDRRTEKPARSRSTSALTCGKLRGCGSGYSVTTGLLRSRSMGAASSGAATLFRPWNCELMPKSMRISNWFSVTRRGTSFLTTARSPSGRTSRCVCSPGGVSRNLSPSSSTGGRVR